MFKSIFIKTDFVGYHRWKDAPDSVAYLRDFHRHVFHVKLFKDVEGLNREIEFHTLKKEVDAYLRDQYENQKFDLSCEQIALGLIVRFKASGATVSEDDECGALISLSDNEEVHQLEIQYKEFKRPNKEGQ